MALKSLWNKPKESFEEGAYVWSPFYGHGVVVERKLFGLSVTFKSGETVSFEKSGKQDSSDKGRTLSSKAEVTE